ncbi:MAG: hypothetical protein ACK5RL_12140 [Acidimicrobiales bacterium]
MMVHPAPILRRRLRAGPLRVGPGRAVGLVAATVLLAGGALAGCGSEAETAAGYSAESKAAFLAACTDADADPRVVRDVCECTYDRTERSIPYEDFASTEQRLILDPMAALPDALAKIMADCLVAEADL